MKITSVTIGKQTELHIEQIDPHRALYKIRAPSPTAHAIWYALLCRLLEYLSAYRQNSSAVPEVDLLSSPPSSNYMEEFVALCGMKQYADGLISLSSPFSFFFPFSSSHRLCLIQSPTRFLPSRKTKVRKSWIKALFKINRRIPI